MTAQVTRVSMISEECQYTGCCVFVRISGDEGDGFFASPSKRNADELCERINGYQQLVIDCNTLRKELERAKCRIKKLKAKVAEVRHD